MSATETRDFLQLDSTLTYSDPEEYVSGSLTFARQIPNSGPSVSNGGNVILNVNSGSEYMITGKSYLRGICTPTFANNTSGATVSALGYSALVSSCNDFLGSKQVSQIVNYPIKRYCELVSAPPALQNCLNIWEGFSPAYTAGNAVTQTTGNVFCIDLPGQLSSCSRALPLPFTGSGYELNIVIGQPNDVYSASASTNVKPTSFSITNLEMVVALSQPSATYLQATKNSIDSGRSLKLAIENCRIFTINVQGSTPFNPVINLGAVSSLNSIDVVQRAGNAVSSATANRDSYIGCSTLTSNSNASGAYGNTAGNGLQTMQVYANNTQYPRSGYVYMNLNGLNSGDYLKMQQVQFGTSYSDLNTSTVAQCNQFLTYPWKSNEKLNSGLYLANGQVQLQMTYVASPSSTDSLSLIANFDTIIEVGKGVVDILY
jgi:hypothetical protein